MGRTMCHAAMRERNSRRYRRKYLTAWGIVALVITAASPAMGQPALADLLGTLNLSAYAPGMWPPPFTGQTVTGRQMSLADFQGRVVLVNCWASWCAACGPEMPMFERLHREFATQGLAILGINVREGAEIIQRYAKKLDLTFPLVLDPKGKITASYGVIGLPTTFLVGRDGRPVALAVGPREWKSSEARALIRTLLAESVAQQEGP